MVSLLWSSRYEHKDNSRCCAISVLNMTAIHPRPLEMSHGSSSQLCALSSKVQQWSMIKPVGAEAKFTGLCLCSAGLAHRDVRPSRCDVHFCGWVRLFRAGSHMRRTGGKQKNDTSSPRLFIGLYTLFFLGDCFWKHAMLLSACCSGSWRLIRYEKAS